MPKNDNSVGNGKTKTADPKRKAVEPTHVIIDSPITGTVTTDPKTDSSKNKTEQPIPRWKDALKPEWVIVYVTAIYTLFAWLQWLTIGRQANLLEHQLVTPFRALLSVANIWTASDSEIGVRIKNSGQVAARITSVTARVTMGALDGRGMVNTVFDETVSTRSNEIVAYGEASESGISIRLPVAMGRNMVLLDATVLYEIGFVRSVQRFFWIPFFRKEEARTDELRFRRNYDGVMGRWDQVAGLLAVDFPRTDKQH